MRDGLHVDGRGTRCWWVNSKRHRTDGPAIERANGTCEWWVNGRLHRVDGPAVEWSDGNIEWCLNDKCYTFREWLEKNTELTPQQKTILMLKYGDG